MRFGSQKPLTRNNREEKDNASSARRADEVRSRRAQRSQKRITTVSNRAANPPPARPVVVRGNYFGRPIHQQAGTHPRRKFYVTMNRTAGTEMRLPAIPVVRPGWRLASALLAILLAAGIFSMWNSPYFQVGVVDVQGLQRLNPAEVDASLRLQNLSIIEVDANQIKEQVSKSYPELINVGVSVELPNAITVTAQERQPVLAVVQGEKTSWIDASGVLFPARGEAGPLVTIHTDDGLPLVPPPLTDEQIATQEASTEGDFAAQKPTAESVPVTGELIVDPTVLTALEGLSKKLPPETQLAYSKDHGLGWKAPEGWQVFIGKDLNNFEEKYTMYQQIASDLVNQGLQPTLVSVEHLNAPYYRLEQ